MQTTFTPHSALNYCRDLVHSIKLLGADDANVLRTSTDTLSVDFDHHQITMSRSQLRDHVSASVFQGGGRGDFQVDVGDGGIEEAIASALLAAQASPADPGNVVAEGVSTAPTVYGPTGADMNGMRKAALQFIADLQKYTPEVRLLLSTLSYVQEHRSFANSQDRTCQETRSYYQLHLAISGRDKSRITSFNIVLLTYPALPVRLIEMGGLRQTLLDTVASLSSRPLKKGFRGSLVVAPSCVPILLAPFITSIGGASLLGDESPYKDQIGQAVSSPFLTIANRPAAVEFPSGHAFDDFGIPCRDLTVVDKGNLRSFLVDHPMAKRLDRKPTAGAIVLDVHPGDTSLEKIIQSVDQGILISRFSGARPNANLDVTGIAKNGFLIRKGERQNALTETMISTNVKSLLMNIAAVSHERINFGNGQFPYLLIDDVFISGASSAR